MGLTERQRTRWLEVGRVLNGTDRKSENYMARSREGIKGTDRKTEN